ncbi:cyclic nucleotide-binding domain-containing protein [Sphingorhabdus sp. Alg239-R122]|uniref:cyclic nucleotide-binding domain-containing protein n=1 Tax=Sphingorhabdus sp. Alg239-R122 TaxID=2305989 RepID=UPI0013DB47F4|nr:cyclic nucleotide-binding domain-containing protein [Sphingorhabdus sp. Alg239-R122]
MRAQDMPAVRDLPLFAGVEDSNFEELVSAALLQHFPPQVQLIHEGDSADFLYILVEGSVELFACNNGRETSMAIIEPTSAFILAAVLSDAVCLMSARTLTPSRLLMIPAEHIKRHFAEDKMFAVAIANELSKAYRQLVKMHKEAKLRPATERLANYLLRLAASHDHASSFTLPADKRTIAALLSMTPENLSRSFGALNPHGVRIQGPVVHIDKPDALAAFAKPNALIDDPEIGLSSR